MMARWLVLVILSFGLGAPAFADAPPWKSDDYFRQYMLHYHGKVPLPHLRSAGQRVLFDHLVDSRNIAAILKARGTPARKLGELRRILATVGAYRASYNLAVSYGEPLQQELTQMQAFGLEVGAAVAMLSRQQGGATCGAVATMISGMIQSIGEEQRYSADQRAEIAEAIARHYPVISPALAANDRKNLRDKASTLDVQVSTGRQRAAFAAMWAAIEAGH